MKMRNVLALLLALALCFSMASCGKKNADVPDASAEMVSSTEPETVSEVESAAATQAESTAAATEATSADEPKVTASNKGNTNSGKKSNSTSKSGGSAAAQKPNGGSSSGAQSQQKPPVAEQPNKKNPELDWTQADVDAAVAEAKRYAKSKGYTVYEDSKITVRIDGNEYKTSWSSPIDTRLDYKSNAKEDLHYQIDKVNKDNGSLCFLHGDEGVGVNIFSINHGSYWEIYVVY